MKNYMDISKKEEAVRIINKIISDDETWSQGIPAIDKELQARGFTSKEASTLECELMKVISRLCKKL